MDAKLEELLRGPFQFLADYSFRVVFATDACVEYRSPSVTLLVRVDEYTHELDVVLRQHAQADAVPGFTILDVVRSVDADSELSAGVIQVGTSNDLEAAIARLASLLRKHGDLLLRGDASAFRRMGAQRRLQALADTEALRLRQLRSKARSAWQKQDYQAVVDAYRQMGGSITPSEEKKMEYARARLHEA